jgi:hypothetical protein
MFLYLLKTDGKDGLFMARIGCNNRFDIYNMFGFKDPDIPVFKEGVIKKARN